MWPYRHSTSLLLRYGADQDYTDHEGRSPLYVAECFGYTHIAEALNHWRELGPIFGKKTKLRFMKYTGELDEGYDWRYRRMYSHERGFMDRRL